MGITSLGNLPSDLLTKSIHDQTLFGAVATAIRVDQERRRVVAESRERRT
jgi:FixJ family two-component response regulator